MFRQCRADVLQLTQVSGILSPSSKSGYVEWKGSILKHYHGSTDMETCPHSPTKDHMWLLETILMKRFIRFSVLNFAPQHSFIMLKCCINTQQMFMQVLPWKGTVRGQPVQWLLVWGPKSKSMRTHPHFSEHLLWLSGILQNLLSRGSHEDRAVDSDLCRLKFRRDVRLKVSILYP